MFVVSRAAECPYCTAHTCSYALRRGTAPEALVEGLPGAKGQLGDAETATIRVARSLGRIPVELLEEERGALISAVGDAQAEMVVFGMCAMGYLNKVMDAIGVELEEEAYLETRNLLDADYATSSKAGPLLDAKSKGAPNPAPDSLITKLRIMCAVPGALMLDAKYIKGVPNTWPQVGTFLKARLAFDFPFLSALNSSSFLGKRAICAIATVLIDNYEPTASVVTVPIKILAGRVFAAVVGSQVLAEQFERLALAHSVHQYLPAADALAAMSPGHLKGDVSKLPEALQGLDPAHKCW